MSAIVAEAPASAIASTQARPRPDAPPVMNADRPRMSNSPSVDQEGRMDCPLATTSRPIANYASHACCRSSEIVFEIAGRAPGLVLDDGGLSAIIAKANGRRGRRR